MEDDRILLAHGAGGLLSSRLLSEVFLPYLGNQLLDRLEDSAVLDLNTQSGKISFSTDSYVVKPIFFPGGNIGSLAVHGTVNDLAVGGARPVYLSAGFIIEEGTFKQDLERIVQSMAHAAEEAGVRIVAGDTKVVARGAADGLYINTSGVGVHHGQEPLSYNRIEPGDSIIINGTIGDHGATILSEREGLETVQGLRSDSAPLNNMVQEILDSVTGVHCMRDATRGGLGAVLVELATQSGYSLEIDERSLPVREEVRGICEIMGLDPLYIANEGKMVVFCAQEAEEQVLQAMQKSPYGSEAAVIGRVQESTDGRVKFRTVLGTHRDIDLPSGEIVPRIC
ncbi:MAG: hydrogenase expression/formation protein HypE [Thermodesulfobacteriota bacterium]